MKLSTTDPRALHVIDRTFQEKVWLDAAWDERTRRCAAAMVDALRDSMDALSIGTGVAAGYAAARAEAPLAAPAYHETWAKVTLALATRELMREASEEAERREDLYAELTRVAVEMAQAAMALTTRDAAPIAVRSSAVERAVREARANLAQARDSSLGDHAAAKFVSNCFNQMSHTLSLFMTREPQSEALVRAAVLRADRAARKDDLRAWLEAPAWTRRALVRQCLAETAGALATAVPDVADATPEGRDAGLWLARTACHVLAAMANVDEWLPAGESEPVTASTSSAADCSDETEEEDEDNRAVAKRGTETKNVETTMKTNETTTVSKQATIVKTLQTDATDAAWRTAGSQFVKLAREPLVGLLSRHLAPGDETMRAKVASFLETDIGTALLASLLSVGLSAMPGVAGEVPQRLSRELRVRAMADAADVTADVLMGPLRQVMALYLQDPSGAMTVSPAALGDSTGKAPSNVVAMPEREAVAK